MLACALTLAADSQPHQCSLLGNVIDAAYRQVLARHMTVNELNRETRAFNDVHYTVAALVKSIALSDEYLEKLAALSPNDQAEALYKSILARSAGADLEATTTLIRRSGVRAAATELLNSPEYRARFGANTVPAAPAAKAHTLCR